MVRLTTIARHSHLVLLATSLFAPFLHAQQPAHAVTPPNAPPRTNRFASAGVDAGDYLYVSGQGPRRADGSVPDGFGARFRQALDNLKAVVESAGLTLDNVVYVQIYLTDMNSYAEMNQIFGEYFAKHPPARAALGVAALPDPAVAVNAIAVRNLDGRKAIYPASYSNDETAPPGVLTHDRLFISSLPGADPTTGKVPDDPAAQVDLALDRMTAVVKAAGLEMSNVVFVNPYLTSEIPSRVMNEHYAKRFEFGNTPGRATIKVSSLPGGTHIEYTGVAVRDLQRRKAIRPKNMPPSPTASPCVSPATPCFVQPRAASFPAPRRRLCHHDPAPTPSDNAESARQPRRSGDGFQ